MDVQDISAQEDEFYSEESPRTLEKDIDNLVEDLKGKLLVRVVLVLTSSLADDRFDKWS
jgi:hypothetical protein